VDPALRRPLLCAPPTGGVESWLVLGEALGRSAGRTTVGARVPPRRAFALTPRELRRAKAVIEAFASSRTELFGPAAIRCGSRHSSATYEGIDPAGSILPDTLVTAHATPVRPRTSPLGRCRPTSSMRLPARRSASRRSALGALEAIAARTLTACRAYDSSRLVTARCFCMTSAPEHVLLVPRGSCAAQSSGRRGSRAVRRGALARRDRQRPRRSLRVSSIPRRRSRVVDP